MRHTSVAAFVRSSFPLVCILIISCVNMHFASLLFSVCTLSAVLLIPVCIPCKVAEIVQGLLGRRRRVNSQGLLGYPSEPGRFLVCSGEGWYWTSSTPDRIRLDYSARVEMVGDESENPGQCNLLPWQPIRNKSTFCSARRRLGC